MELEVSKEELELRKASWAPIIKECGKGVLPRYAKQVASALEGAVLRRD